MNERIKELILKAGFPKFDQMYVVSDGAELEKFAELIVKECANYAFSDGQDHKAMLKHFGYAENKRANKPADNLDGHTCSYYCDRPGCIKAQRDELRDQMEQRIAYAVKSAIEGEREACARACEENVCTLSYDGSITREECVEAIRARGEVK